MIDITPSQKSYVRMLSLILKRSPVLEDRQFAFAELEKILSNWNEGEDY